MKTSELKQELNNYKHATNELHARIDLLEAIVKEVGLWNYYCQSCFDYHKTPDKNSYFISFPLKLEKTSK